MRPTDVRNHFSGWPVTVIGADLWTCSGKAPDGKLSVEADGVLFTFAESRLPAVGGARSCLEEGQLPHLWFWKL